MGHWNEKTLAMDYFVDITDLSKYVSGVRVNPFAEEWYVKLIEGICGEYNIKFMENQIYMLIDKVVKVFKKRVKL